MQPSPLALKHGQQPFVDASLPLPGINLNFHNVIRNRRGNKQADTVCEWKYGGGCPLFLYLRVPLQGEGQLLFPPCQKCEASLKNHSIECEALESVQQQQAIESCIISVCFYCIVGRHASEERTNVFYNCRCAYFVLKSNKAWECMLPFSFTQLFRHFSLSLFYCSAFQMYPIHIFLAPRT